MTRNYHNCGDVDTGPATGEPPRAVAKRNVDVEAVASGGSSPRGHAAAEERLTGIRRREKRKKKERRGTSTVATST